MGGVSGKDFITAVALGNDLSIRLASGPKGGVFDDYPWFPITVFGTFSAAAAPAKLMGLSEEKMTNVLGIALSRVFGVATEVIFDPDSELRSIRDGFTNKEGILSALLAELGIAASKDPIEKLYKIYYGNEIDSEVVTQDLGKTFKGVTAGLKPWPTTKQIHGHIQATFHLIKENSITPDQIEEVILTVGKFRKDYLCEPLEEKRNPKYGINAKSSLPFTIAVALVKGRVGIGDFLPQGLADPQVLEMARRIKYIFDPEFGVLTPAVVEIRTRGGKVFSKRIDTVYGGSENPLSNEDVVAKFKDCAQYARNPIPPDNADRLIEGIFKLEEVKDMKEITALLN
jgi:2-methylcitrate dehydratase PrpD